MLRTVVSDTSIVYSEYKHLQMRSFLAKRELVLMSMSSDKI